MSKSVDDDVYAALDIAGEKAEKHAIGMALATPMDFPREGLSNIPQTFGAKWVAKIKRVRERLSDRYPKNFDFLIQHSCRYFIYARERDSKLVCLINEIAEGQKTEKEKKAIAFPDGCFDEERWASTMASALGEINKPHELLLNSGFSDFPNEVDCLDAIAIYWFFIAAARYKENQIKAMDLLVEVAEALELSNGLFMWSEGAKCNQESNENPASALAKRRHAENYALIADAVKYWREKIDPTISASKAASELVQVVPLSHKKIAEVIAAEKKKQP